MIGLAKTIRCFEGASQSYLEQTEVSVQEITTNTFTPPHPLKTAVLFLVFNRPDTTKQVFEAIRQAKPPRLYVAADGPRNTQDKENILCDEVRRISTDVDWESEVKTLFFFDNLGCKKAVSSAIDWFFNNEEQGIILEDDCLPAQSFFWFCEYCLKKYHNDLRIMQISGFNPLGKWEDGWGYFFSKFGPIWGWASWRRAWYEYDVTLKKWPQIREDKQHHNFCDSFVERIWRERLFDNVHEGNINTWDYQWSFAKHINNGLTIIPKRNLISNIGFSPDATHTTNNNYSTPCTYEIIIHEFPEIVVDRNRKFDNNYLKYFAKIGIMQKFFLTNLVYKLDKIAQHYLTKTLYKFSKKNSIIDNSTFSIDSNILNNICNFSVLNLTEEEYNYFCEKTQLFNKKSIRQNPKKTLEFFFSYRLLKIKEGDCILDAAGGDGSYCQAIHRLTSGTRCIVCDQSHKENFAIGDIEYIGGDVESIPIDDGSVDKISCHHAFEHFQSEKDINFIQEISRVLKKGGLACIIPLFVADKYIELWNIEAKSLFDKNAQLVIDKSSTLPGANQDGHFARIYDKTSLQKRVIDIATGCNFEVSIVECRLEGDIIPKRKSNIGSKLNSPLRALLLLKNDSLNNGENSWEKK